MQRKRGKALREWSRRGTVKMLAVEAEERNHFFVSWNVCFERRDK
jgi:hypothetical protein